LWGKKQVATRLANSVIVPYTEVARIRLVQPRGDFSVIDRVKQNGAIQEFFLELTTVIGKGALAHTEQY
jgi:hypothetical protein